MAFNGTGNIRFVCMRYLNGFWMALFAVRFTVAGCKLLLFINVENFKCIRFFIFDESGVPVTDKAAFLVDCKGSVNVQNKVNQQD